MNARAYLFHSTITVELVVSLGRSLMNRLVAKLMQAAYFWWLQKYWKRYGKCLFWENQQEEQCFHGKTVKSRKSYKTSFNNSRNWSVAFCSFLVRLNNFHLTQYHLEHYFWEDFSATEDCALRPISLRASSEAVDHKIWFGRQERSQIAKQWISRPRFRWSYVFLPMNHILHGFCSEWNTN